MKKTGRNLPPQPAPTATDSPEALRARIVAAARRHFFAHGFRNITTDDLAAALGISKKTLYVHFPSKVAVLEAVLRDKFRQVRAELEAITSAPARDFPGVLSEMLACLQRHTEEIQPPLIHDLRRGEPEVFRIVEEERHDIIQHYFGKVFAEGRRAGCIRRDVPVKVIIEILLSATHAIMNPPKLEAFRLTPRAAFSAIITIVTQGIFTPSSMEVP